MFYLERSKLAREKQLREEVEREKAALEARLIQYQEEVSYFSVAERPLFWAALGSFRSNI